MPVDLSDVLLGLLTLGVLVVVFQAGGWKKDVDRDRTRVNNTLRVILRRVNALFREIERLGAVRNTTRRTSPLQLTDLGREVSAQLEASQWATETAHALRAEIQGMEPYRIRDFVKEYVDNTPLGSEMDAKISRCMSEFALDEQQVLDVLAVELRDVLLPEHTTD